MTKADEDHAKALDARNESYLRFASSASDAIAQGIAGEKSFAQVLAGTTASIIDNLERQALAGIIANSVKTGKNPILSIIGATAGFAAVKGLFARISRGNSSSSGGGGSSYSESRVAQSGSYGAQSSSPTPVLETQIRGQDLWVVLKNYESSKYSTHG